MIYVTFLDFNRSVWKRDTSPLNDSLSCLKTRTISRLVLSGKSNPVKYYNRKIYDLKLVEIDRINGQVTYFTKLAYLK